MSPPLWIYPAQTACASEKSCYIVLTILSSEASHLTNRTVSQRKRSRRSDLPIARFSRSVGLRRCRDHPRFRRLRIEEDRIDERTVDGEMIPMDSIELLRN